MSCLGWGIQRGGRCSFSEESEYGKVMSDVAGWGGILWNLGDMKFEIVV